MLPMKRFLKWFFLCLLFVAIVLAVLVVGIAVDDEQRTRRGGRKNYKQLFAARDKVAPLIYETA